MAVGRRRAVVVGGSLGGLAAGISLREIGWEAEVFERSRGELRGRGAGIVVQPELLRFLVERGIPSGEVGVPAEARQYLDRDGRVMRTERRRQTMTSWGTAYRHLRTLFPEERYHGGMEFVGFEEGGGRVVARFDGGGKEACDLLVGADGTHSVLRRLLLPEAVPEYAGYVAWRGLVEESRLNPTLARMFSEKFTFFLGRNTQILCYLIPGPSGELARGERLLNWVWYWNVPEGEGLRDVLTDSDGETHDYSVPEGRVRKDIVERQKAIAWEALPEVFGRLVAETDEPFVQVIHDLSVPRMAFGRACLVGDAAFVPRPHTAASTAKAVANATSLAGSLSAHGDDVPAALKIWEPAQLRLGRRLEEHGRALGDGSQFG